MQLQAIFLILTIFVSYLVLGGGNSTREKEAQELAKGTSFKEKISNVIVGGIIVFNQGARGLENQFDNLIASAKEIAHSKTETSSAATEQNSATSSPQKDFNRLPPEELDSQIASYRIVTEKIETNGQINNVKCDTKGETLPKSRTALIKYLDYNFNLFEFNATKRWPIASVSKLMTSVVALEKIGLEKEMKMSATAVATEGITGGFKAGETFKTEDLLKAMMVVSSNDAAMAVAEDFGKEQFVDLMNQKAKELGMNDTYYEEPTGLSFLNQSTANDLVKLANYIYANHPQILEISRQKEVLIKELNTKKSRKLLNINRFAGQADFIGGKTGYIDESGRNLVAFFNKDNKIILTIVLGAENAFEETKKIISCN